MFWGKLLLVLMSFFAITTPIYAQEDIKFLDEKTVEPRLWITKHSGSAPQVALTLDLCMGKTDMRILDMLIEHKIKATFFMTARWLVKNPEAIEKIKQHLDLFEIGNHGAQHLPAIDNMATIYGIKTAGSLPRIFEEVKGGQQAIIAAGFKPPYWYRTAAARYSHDALSALEKAGYHIAGFSLNGDEGASLREKDERKRIERAKDGDVIMTNSPRAGGS